MTPGYHIKLADRNETLEYRDRLVLCRFGLRKIRKEWILQLPAIWDDGVRSGELSESDTERVLPQIVSYLKKIYWFGFIPMSYKVRVVRRDDNNRSWQDVKRFD